MTDSLDKFKDVDLEKLIIDDLVNQIRKDESERLSHIIMENKKLNFFDKIDYGFYWFGVCWKEWYDTVMLGYYDEYEEPAWDFFNHINCNYPLEYRIKWDT